MTDLEQKHLTPPTKKEIKKNFDYYKEIVTRFNEICAKKKAKEHAHYAVSALKPLFDRFVAQVYESKVFNEKCIEVGDFQETKRQHHAFSYSHDGVYISYSEQTNPGESHFYKDIEIEVDNKRVYSKDSDGFEIIFVKKC